VNHEKSALALSVLAVLLVLTTGVAGIVFDDGGRPYSWDTLRGESVEMYGGDGIYRHDSFRKAVVVRGFDLANLTVGLPLLITGIFLYRRGRLRGEFLLAATFAYLAYNYLIALMGNSFNEMFLVWTALFSVGLFGLVLVVAGIDRVSLPQRVEATFPRRSLAIYLILLATFLLVQYLVWVLSAYLSGSPPRTLGPYTTLELPALELGIMVPLHFVGGVLLWRGRPAGYVFGIILVFAAFMTFLSLTFAVGMLHFLYGKSSVFEVGLVATLATIAAVFSVWSFRRVKNVRLAA
jgi:hypothetical protein